MTKLSVKRIIQLVFSVILSAIITAWFMISYRPRTTYENLDLILLDFYLPLTLFVVLTLVLLSVHDYERIRKFKTILFICGVFLLVLLPSILVTIYEFVHGCEFFCSPIFLPITVAFVIGKNILPFLAISIVVGIYIKWQDR